MFCCFPSLRGGDGAAHKPERRLEGRRAGYWRPLPGALVDADRARRGEPSAQAAGRGEQRRAAGRGSTDSWSRRGERRDGDGAAGEARAAAGDGEARRQAGVLRRRTWREAADEVRFGRVWMLG